LPCLNDHCEVGLTGVLVDLSGVVCGKNRLTNSSLACPGASCAAGIKKSRKPFPDKGKRLRPFKSKTSGELQQTELLGDRRESGVLLHEPFSTRAYPIMLVPLPEKTPEVLYAVLYPCFSTIQRHVMLGLLNRQKQAKNSVRIEICFCYGIKLACNRVDCEFR
jgi:hypothetical protein